MKFIQYILIVILIAFLNTTVALANSYPRELNFCTTDWNPYEYIESSHAKGVNVEIVEAVANTLGITIKWNTYPWARCVNMAKHGSVDGLMSLYRSTERENFFYYPDENVNIDECVFVTYTGSQVTFDGTIESLTGENVIVARENSYGKDFDEATNFIKEVAPNQDNIVLMIANKRRKIGIGSRKRFEKMVKEHDLADKIIILSPPYMIKTYFAFSRKKGVSYRTLANDFSEGLKKFKTTEQYRRIWECSVFCVRSFL